MLQQNYGRYTHTRALRMQRTERDKGDWDGVVHTTPIGIAYRTQHTHTQRQAE
jgi:hypothetical protein